MLCRFQNINYRVNTQFVLFTGGIGNVAAPAYNIVAQSPIIVNSVPNQPVQASHPAWCCLDASVMALAGAVLWMICMACQIHVHYSI